MKTAIRLTTAIFLLAASNLSAASLYVSAASSSPSPPYNSWATAAHSIMDAVTAAAANDVIYVTNGTYPGGLILDKPVWVLGIGGAQFTFIDGGGANRCVWMTNGVHLEGFTLTNGNGGGVFCSSTNAYITNCVIAGNRSTGFGGGAQSGRLDRCTLRGNLANAGGGANFATLNNCLVISNSVFADEGGGTLDCNLNNCVLIGNVGKSVSGAYGGTLNNCVVAANNAYGVGGIAVQFAELNNCIVYFNSAAGGSSNAQFCTFNYSCTKPLPSTGVGNIDLNPQFVNLAGGNLRLQATSPCINSGNNAFVFGATDLDGNPRIVGGTVDMGAYEFQGAGSVISYAGCSSTVCPPMGRLTLLILMAMEETIGRSGFAAHPLQTRSRCCGWSRRQSLPPA